MKLCDYLQGHIKLSVYVLRLYYCQKMLWYPLLHNALNILGIHSCMHPSIHPLFIYLILPLNHLPKHGKASTTYVLLKLSVFFPQGTKTFIKAK